MTIDRSILVGRDVYSRDDLKVGEIKGVTGDAEFVNVSRSPTRDLLMPMDELHEIHGRLEIRRTRSSLDDAPVVPPDHITLDARRRLEEFYRTRAA